MKTVVGRRLGIASIAAVASLLVVAGHVEAQCQYEVTIIQAPECPIFGFPPTIGLGLSEQGHVVGYHFDCEFIDDEAFVWTPETGLVTLPFPAGTIRKQAFDIEGGLIVGRFDVLGDGLGDLAFLHDGQEVTNLGTLPAGNFSEAKAISAMGIVTGFWGNFVTGDPSAQAFLWKNRQMIDLGPSIGGVASRAFDLSESGALTGWWRQQAGGERIAFIWQDAVMTDLGPIPGGLSSEGHGINCHSQVAGWGKVQSAPTVWHAFVCVEATMIDIGTLPTFADSFAMDIGDAGQVIGSCADSDVFPTTGFIWQDNVMTDLNELIDPGLGVHISSGRAINHAGVILAGGTVQGDAVAVLLTPIEPPLGDLTGDCRVGILDLLTLLANWGPCPTKANCPADVNGDGTVDVLDLLMLLSNWG